MEKSFWLLILHFQMELFMAILDIKLDLWKIIDTYVCMFVKNHLGLILVLILWLMLKVVFQLHLLTLFGNP